jgi:ankyrin repeat protein
MKAFRLENGQLMSKQEIEKNINLAITQWVNAKTRSDDEWTALHIATQPKKKELFTYLHCKLGADLFIKNKYGVSLMHKAACDDNTYLITYLRDKAGFEISETDVDGNTPLHYACLTGADYACFWLLGFGQDCNLVNNLGETALH